MARRPRLTTSSSGSRIFMMRSRGPQMSALLLLAVGSVVLAAGFWFRNQPPVSGPALAAGAATVGKQQHCTPGSRMTVRRGDTLWGLAQRCAAPQGDPRTWVEALREANGLTAQSVLEPGRTLQIPDGPGRRVRQAAREDQGPAGR